MALNVTIKDFSIICRVCLKSSQNFVSISLFQIVEMMGTCTSVQIWINDDLPNQLCDNCYHELRNSFDFKQRAEKSDSDLRQIIEIYKNEDNVSTKYAENDTDIDGVKDELKLEVNNDVFTNKNEVFESPVATPKSEELLSPFNVSEDSRESVESEKSVKKNKYECAECDFTCKHIHHLGLHMKRYHQTKGQSCSKCTMVFYLPAELERHMKTHAYKSKKSKCCGICNKPFTTRSNLLRHSIAVHGTEKPHKCNKCGNTFKLYSALSVHQRSAHPKGSDLRVPCDICGKRVLKREIKRHLQIHSSDREMIQCSQCDKKFLHQCSLKLHIQRSHENKPREYKHLCTICGKKFGTRNDLERHGSVHRNDRPFECPQCGKGFKLNHNLKSHIKQIHMNMKGDNRIPCKVCGKLISKTNMKTHLATHKEVRDVYSCTRCTKQFLHQFSLEQHILKFHEKIVREFQHLCNMCGKGFNTRTELKIHMLSHSDEKTFECQTCGMKYKTMHGLRYHVKSVHLNLKPHPCPVCLRHFSTRGVVERHMRTHTGERPFSCTLCEKSFNQKSTLTTHLRLVHSA